VKGELLVISLWQPWATWVMWGWKTIETRLHSRFASLACHRIGIHAAKRWDDNAIRLARPYLTDRQIEFTQSFTHARGALICTTFVPRYISRLIYCEARLALIECDTPRSGLSLIDVERFEPPIPMRGRQGVWTISYPLLSEGKP
jgi:hypothetical protein